MNDENKKVKICRVCGASQNDVEFAKNRMLCSPCYKTRQKEYRDTPSNNEKSRLCSQRWRIDHPLPPKPEKPKISEEEQKRLYKAKKSVWDKNYHDRKKPILTTEELEELRRQKETHVLLSQMRERVSGCIRNALKKVGRNKNGETSTKYLPYSLETLKEHIEKQFNHPDNLVNEKVWMTWKNWGLYRVDNWNENDVSTWTWQLDHIIPQTDLPYLSMTDENFQKCWALENLRPLSAKKNHEDGVRRTRHENKSRRRSPN